MRTAHSAVPSETFWQEMRQGWAATRLLVALRWRMVRSRPARMAIFVGLAMVLFGVLLAINLGYAVQLATQQGDTVSGIYARVWVRSLQGGSMAGIGALAVGGAVLVAFFAPFTGTSTLALAPLEDLEAIRPPRAHRFFDALLLNAVSGIGVVQMLALTAVAGLLTIDGARLPAFTFTWSVWMFLIVLTTAVGWSLEYVIRKHGRVRRNLIGLGALAAVALAVALDENHGATLFGAADVYTYVIRLGVGGWSMGIAIAIGLMLACSAALVVAGVQATRMALRLPAPSLRVSRRHRSGKVRALPPSLLGLLLLVRTIVRTTECRRPLIAVAVVGLPAMFFLGLDENVEIAVALAIPLTVALAWGVNVFAVLGTGMPWLASQPHLLGPLLRAAAALQFLTTSVLLFLMWFSAEIAGKAPPGVGVRLVVSGLISTLLVTAASAYLAVFRPRRTRLSGRGDSLVPPLTALGYLGWLVLLSAYAPLVLSLPASPEQTMMLLGAAVVLAFAWLAFVDVGWRTPRVRAKVVETVGAA